MADGTITLTPTAYAAGGVGDNAYVTRDDVIGILIGLLRGGLGIAIVYDDVAQTIAFTNTAGGNSPVTPTGLQTLVLTPTTLTVGT